MYIGQKTDVLGGPARIGRVRFLQTGRTLYYRGRSFQSLSGRGFKANYFDVATGEEFWISGCKKRGGDSLYGALVEIDDDVREEYWTTIRKMPDRCPDRLSKCVGKYGK
jgi:hypothetical protein